ncbi:hypothetical protein ABW21_db0209345 [Orbilia brochopaga]|nr:hypothetical protein ABW21_db0209345 [Drechslerella brochopaga]
MSEASTTKSGTSTSQVVETSNPGPSHENESHKNTAVREVYLRSTQDDGSVVTTRLIELSSPGPLATTSLVAVIKPGQPPYLAQLDLTSPTLQDDLDPNGSFTGAPEPEMISITKVPTASLRRASASVRDYSIDEIPLVMPSNRMIRIPLAEPYNIQVSRDPNAAGDPDGKFLHSRDPEKDAPVKNMTFAPGYPSTAAIMSTDAELSVYRRFDRLSARNLLYYQAELMYLESELDKLDEEDRLLENAEEKYHLRHFKELWDGLDERTAKRRSVIQEIRFLMREYRMCYFQFFSNRVDVA